MEFKTKQIVTSTHFAKFEENGAEKKRKNDCDQGYYNPNEEEAAVHC